MSISASCEAVIRCISARLAFFLLCALPLAAAVSCSGKSVLTPSSDYVQSAQLQSGFITRISTGDARNLYTISVFNPKSGYAGSSRRRFRIKGSGSMRPAGGTQSALSVKAVPVGNDDWQGVIFYNYDVGNMVQDASFWYADETNKIKYYIAENALNGVFSELSEEYWDEMRGHLTSGTLSEDVLGRERESFGLREYNKDETDYFYVVICDFGSNSMLPKEGKWSGVVGLYSQNNIRPGRSSSGKYFSNEADVFYINSRYVEGYSEVHLKDKEGDSSEHRRKAAEIAVSTLVHEYMHYLMDSNLLLKAEEEFSDEILPETGTIYDESGYAPSGRYSDLIKDLTSGLYGSSFWIEGSANYASYRMIGDSDPNAVSEWLGIMSRWRPAISAYDGRSQADNVYAVYGAGGLFFSYVAETYGEQTENEFHSWRDTAASLSEMSAGGDAGSYCGNINVMAGSILKRDFKDVYSDFLCQCLLSLSDKSVIPGKTQREFKSAADWGFVKSNVDAAIDKQGFAISDAARGYESSDVEELAFVINRWDEIPERIEFEGDEFDCYAIWF